MPPFGVERKSPRLKGYDYSQPNLYFVTICTYRRLHLFGQIKEGVMYPNELGKVVQSEITHLSDYWPTITIDSYVVMPNHLHLIIDVGTPFLASGSKPANHLPTLGTIIGGFKAGITRIARQRLLIPNNIGSDLWQARYHEHIIRDESAFNQIQTYILENPARWQNDTFFNDELYCRDAKNGVPTVLFNSAPG
jgi:putative transposase